MATVLLDTDTLSEIIKGRDVHVSQRAARYLATYGRFTFSIITRYEILRGLRAKNAVRQIQAFDDRCRNSLILPLSEEVVVVAADIYGELYRRGQLISDADILIAATAMVYQIGLVTENVDHFERVAGLQLDSWRASD